MSAEKFKPLIVPIFIPNQGCPHRCVFCEQERITSQFNQPVNGRHIEKILDQAIHSKDFNRGRMPEIAFYGGTFTGLSLDRIRELLEAAVPYLKRGFFRSIRVSTRPDSIDSECLQLMKDHGVDTVELGVQSMNNNVLTLSKRGHTAEDTVRAVQILKEFGFRVGAQLMPGLPGDTKETFQSTIRQVIDLRPHMSRLYPALVIRGTTLARWYRDKRYQPMALEEAVQICMESCILLEAENIPVIRIGLMSSPSLLEDGQIVAGPWHPAFGFLVRSGVYRKNLESILPRPGDVSQIKISVQRKAIPLLRGFKNQGLKWIENKTQARVIKVDSDDSIPFGMARFEAI